MNNEENKNYETNETGNNITHNEEINVQNINNTDNFNDINKNRENINYETNKEIGKNIKSNEEVMKEKVDNIMNDLNDVDQKETKRKRKKTLFFIFAIILEVLVIAYILYERKPKQEYNMTLKCTNNESELNKDYSMKMTNTYYFNKDREVVKTSNEILYAYNDQDSYNKFINTVNEPEVNFKGYKKQSVKDDKNYIYKSVTTYTYSELKKNKEVKYKDNLFTFKLPNNQEEISIIVQNYDEVANTNNMMNFTCE